MKLYTEEQLKQAVDKAMTMWLLSESSKEEILDSLTPIELPSDEEISKESRDKTTNIPSFSFINGAKWIRDKLNNIKDK